MRGAARTDKTGWGVGSALVAGALSVGCVTIALGGQWWREALAGWGVAAVNAAAAAGINRFAVRAAGGFAWKGLILNALRSLALLGAILMVFAVLGRREFSAFFLATFTAYFVFMAAEIARLHITAAGGQTRHE